MITKKRRKVETVNCQIQYRFRMGVSLSIYLQTVSVFVSLTEVELVHFVYIHLKYMFSLLKSKADF